MKKLLFTLALTAGLSVADASAQDTYILSYDRETGSLTIKASGNISAYAIGGNGDVFNNSQFTPFIPGSVVQSDADTVGEVLFGVGVGAGEYALGDGLLQTGLDLTGFENVISAATYTPGIGNLSQNFDLEVIPEPSSLALLGLGGLLITRRRRP